jgi:uncharacterized RDD family membrane protein YckC
MTISEPHDNGHDDPADPRGHGPVDTTAQPPVATEAPPIPFPDPVSVPVRGQGLVGPRIAAALVDVALLAGLFVIEGLAVGGAPVPTPGVFSTGVGVVYAAPWRLRLGEVTVAGWWLALYLAAVLVYYFAFEAATGRTPGKRLLGLRVVHCDGTRPSPRAIAARTLLRLVDWLPLLYLAGFVTMLATGQRRQRLGDLAARTQVDATGAAPVRRGRQVLAGTLAGLAILGMSVRVTSGGTVSPAPPGAIQACQGVSFRYPAGWHQEPVRTRDGDGHASCQTGLFISASDAVVISAYPLPGPAGNLASIAAIFKAGIRRLATQEGGALQAGPRRITVGGRPALMFRISDLSYDGARVESTLNYTFVGRTEYAINCQETPKYAAQVTRACDQVLRTFTVGS